MIILEGKPIAAKIKETLKKETEGIVRASGKRPGLAVILAGDDPASHSYVDSKEKTCKEIGYHSEVFRLAQGVSEKEILKHISSLNARNDIHGILVQLPLPVHINEENVINSISPDKDVDGFHPFNVGRLVIGNPVFVPCTPFGIIRLLQEYKISAEGKHAVVIGRSNIVGKPIANLLLQKSKTGNATVTVCHSKTKNIKELCRSADIIIAAMGHPGFVTADMVKEGAVVIDVGINRVEDPKSPKGYRLVGDVKYDEVSQKASAITPVPGGVGLMTVAMLMESTLLAFKNLNKLTTRI